MQANREKQGTIVGVVGIIWNLILAVIKFFIGFVTNSISIQSDAINNLGDTVSSAATTICFIVSGKKADRKHPYGHGRIEYLAGMLIAILVMFVGCQFLFSSVEKIMNPTAIQFNWVFFAVLIVSAFAKVALGFFYIISNKKIKSATIKVASVDSFQDAAITAVTIISFALANVVKFPIDGLTGLLVSIIIVINGIKMIKETMDPLIGSKTNPELISRIKSIVMGGDQIIGIHDLLLHEYGANKAFASVDAEIPDTLTLMEAHKIIDGIERTVKKELNVDLSIHIDPVDIDCEFSRRLKREMRVALQNYSPSARMHGFDYLKDENKIFCDVEVPYDDKNAEKVVTKIMAKIAEDEKILIEFTIDYH